MPPPPSTMKFAGSAALLGVSIASGYDAIRAMRGLSSTPLTTSIVAKSFLDMSAACEPKHMDSLSAQPWSALTSILGLPYVLYGAWRYWKTVVRCPYLMFSVLLLINQSIGGVIIHSVPGSAGAGRAVLVGGIGFGMLLTYRTCMLVMQSKAPMPVVPPLLKLLYCQAAAVIIGTVWHMDQSTGQGPLAIVVQSLLTMVAALIPMISTISDLEHRRIVLSQNIASYAFNFSTLVTDGAACGWLTATFGAWPYHAFITHMLIAPYYVALVSEMRLLDRKRQAGGTKSKGK